MGEVIRAADDVSAIREARSRIEREEGPRCPRNAEKSQYNCLRESARCPAECPNYNY